MINVQLFTEQILVPVSKLGHAYLSPRISLLLDSGGVMPWGSCIIFKKGLLIDKKMVEGVAYFLSVSVSVYSVSIVVTVPYNEGKLGTIFLRSN